MFEQFFGGTSAPNGVRSNTVRFRVSKGSGSGMNEQAETETGPFLEKIELGDELLIVVDSFVGEPVVKIEGREVIISSPIENRPDLKTDIPWAADVEKSVYSYRNGVLEIKIVKSEDPDNSSDIKEAYLDQE